MPIPLGILAVAGAGAAGGGAFDLLETTVLSSTASSISFSSIDQSYKHLQLRIVGRSSFAAPGLRFNGDSAANYVTHRLFGNGSSVTSSAPAVGAGSIIVNGVVDSSSTASAFGGIVLDILDYSNTNKNKTTRQLGGRLDGIQTGIFFQSGLWMNTNAITSITLESFGTYAIGSRFSLYGVK